MSMLPDKDIKCHRTGFQMSCFDGVVQHKCRLWCHVSGTDAMGRDIDVYGCGDELDLKLLHEVAKEVRQTAASMDKVANETEKMRDGMTARDVQMVNAMRANILRLVENRMTDGDDRLTKPLTQVVGALQGTPMLLVLAVLNVLILGMVVYLAKARSETVAAERTEILKLLDDCLGRQKSSLTNPSQTTSREKTDVQGQR